MSEFPAAGRHGLNSQTLQNTTRLVAIVAAILLLAWMEWHFALH
jgi:hypothetical protein